MLLVRQAAMTTLTVERLQMTIVSGGDADPELLIRLANTQTRSLQELGLGLKRGRGAAPSGSTELADYLSALHQDDVEVEEVVETDVENTKTGGLESGAVTEHAAPATDIEVAELVDGSAP